MKKIFLFLVLFSFVSLFSAEKEETYTFVWWPTDPYTGNKSTYVEPSNWLRNKGYGNNEQNYFCFLKDILFVCPSPSYIAQYPSTYSADPSSFVFSSYSLQVGRYSTVYRVTLNANKTTSSPVCADVSLVFTVKTCPDMPICEKYTCEGCHQSFCSVHGSHSAVGVEIGGECKGHYFCGDNANNLKSLFQQNNTLTCGTCHNSYCKVCGHNCPLKQSCDIECTKKQCGCGLLYCPVHDPAPITFTCSICGELYCSHKLPHSCRTEHERTFGHVFNPCPYCSSVCLDCDSSHECRTDHERTFGHKAQFCLKCHQVCVICDPSHECTTDHELLYGHPLNACGVNGCQVCKTCRPDHLHGTAQSHSQIYGHEYNECSHSGCSICQSCEPHEHKGNSGSPVTPSEPVKKPVSTSGSEVDTVPVSFTIKRDSQGNIVSIKGDMPVSTGSGSSDDSQYSPLVVPTLSDSAFTSSSSSLSRLKSRLLPSSSFLTIQGDTYPSFRVPLDLSGAPFYARDFSFTVGGWNTVANGSLLTAMTISRAISLFVFALIFTFAVIRSLRQW